MNPSYLLSAAFVLIFTSTTVTAEPDVRAFIDGKRHQFKASEHQKANGLNLIISYPEDWTPREGNGPHIVQKFISENGRGTENFTVLVKGTQLDPPTVEEMTEVFALKNLHQFAPENAQIIKSENTKLEGLPAGMIEYTVDGERLGNKTTFHTLSVVFIFKTHFVTISFTVFNAPDSTISLKDHFASFRPLFLAIANSISLPDKWK